MHRGRGASSPKPLGQKPTASRHVYGSSIGASSVSPTQPRASRIACYCCFEKSADGVLFGHRSAMVRPSTRYARSAGGAHMPGKAHRIGPYSRRTGLAKLDARTSEGRFFRAVVAELE